MTIIVKDIGIVMDEARLHNFPAPLSSITEQVFTAAMGAGLARVDDGNVIKLWEKFGVPSSVDEGTLSEEEEKAKELDVQPGGNPGKVLVVGLGVMGLPMAITLLKSGFNVVGADLSAEALKAFEAEGGRVSSDVDLEAQDSNVVLFATVSAAQAEAVLFGKDGSGGIASGRFTFVKLKLICSPAIRSYRYSYFDSRSVRCHADREGFAGNQPKCTPCRRSYLWRTQSRIQR